MKNNNMVELLTRLISGNKVSEIRKLAEKAHPSDFAAALSEAGERQRDQILSQIPLRRRALIFSFLPEEEKLDHLLKLKPEEVAQLFLHLSHDERADLVEVLEPDFREKVLDHLAQKERADVERLQAYGEDTIGAIMTSDFARLKAGLTVGEALQELKRIAPDTETIYYAYILDENDLLKGVVSLSDLVVADNETLIEAVMKTELITLHTRSEDMDAVRELNRTDLFALPVLDRQNKMVGIVTWDDIADVAEEESTESFHRFGGAAGLVNLNMRTASFATLYLRRIPWLLVLVFMNIFSGAGIAYFEDTIEAVVALVFFLPLLIDSGGNAGSQSATLMVRSLALGDVKLRDWFKLLGREFCVALILGISMGLAVSLIGLYRGGIDLAVVVASTMVCTVVVGSLIGMLLPFGLARFRMDPATASAPLVTSLADIAGVLIYFGIATWYFGL